MSSAGTSWARESARLAYFAVAMSERRDDALLLLYEQTNNALESYLKATKQKPPRLSALPGTPPPGPLPSIPPRTSSRRPLSIMAPAVLPKQGAPEPKSAWSEPSSAVTDESSSDAHFMPDKEACRQYRVAFNAVDAQLPRSDYRRYMVWLAMYDVCLGKSIGVAAAGRQVGPGALQASMLEMKSIGPKAFLDGALSLQQPPGHPL